MHRMVLAIIGVATLLPLPAGAGDYGAFAPYIVTDQSGDQALPLMDEYDILKLELVSNGTRLTAMIQFTTLPADMLRGDLWLDFRGPFNQHSWQCSHGVHNPAQGGSVYCTARWVPSEADGLQPPTWTDYDHNPMIALDSSNATMTIWSDLPVVDLKPGVSVLPWVRAWAQPSFVVGDGYIAGPGLLMDELVTNLEYQVPRPEMGNEAEANSERGQTHSVPFMGGAPMVLVLAATGVFLRRR